MQSVAHMKDHERASMERELVWLLEQSIPESISHITQHLSEISIIKDTPNKGSTKQSLQAGLTANKNADISGTATVSGAVVTQLSLTLPPSYSQPAQEAAVSVYLKKGDVLPLRQAQEAQSYIKSALSKAQTAHMFGSNEEAVNVVERLLRDIQKARRILTADGCQDLMPLQSDNSEKFAPVLPENVVIECRLEGRNLIVHVYWLKFRQGVKSTGILDAFKRDQSVGHILVHGGRLAEVRNETVLRASLEEFQQNLEELDHAAGICSDIIGQLHAFDCIQEDT